MIYLNKNQTEPHKGQAIDKRAIHNLISHLQWEIERDHLNVVLGYLTDETLYRIIKIDSYENIIFKYPFDDCQYLEAVQPIDRENNQLYPVQVLVMEPSYKRY